MTQLETTAFWISLFALGCGMSLAFVIWLIRKPLFDDESQYMADHAEMQDRAVTRINGIEIETGEGQ